MSIKGKETQQSLDSLLQAGSSRDTICLPQLMPLYPGDVYIDITTFYKWTGTMTGSRTLIFFKNQLFLTLEAFYILFFLMTKKDIANRK